VFVQAVLEGLPDLQELDLYGNRISEVVVPCSSTTLARLKVLDLGYNDIIHLPEELDQLKSLRTLKLMNNFLSLVPMRVCDMDLKVLDVTSNPVTTPPLDTCDRGIYSMKRYWAQIRIEEKNKKRANMRSYQVQLQQHRMHNRFLVSHQRRAVEEPPYEARPRRYGNASGSHSSRAAHSRIEFINPPAAVQSGANHRDQVGGIQSWNTIDGSISISTFLGSDSSAEINTRTAVPTLTPVEQVEEPVSVGRPVSLAVEPKSRQFAGAEHESTTTEKDVTTSTGSVESHQPENEIENQLSFAPTVSSSGDTVSLTVDQDTSANLGAIGSTAKAVFCDKIQDRLGRCTAPAGCCFFQKRLWLNDLHLREVDIPIPTLCGTALGATLHQLSLANNPLLGYIPPQLVTSLPALRILDVSQCNLRSLPEFFCLPKLQSLSLRFNRLTDFLDEVSLLRVHNSDFFGYNC
jgi:Leucine rich repeat